MATINAIKGTANKPYAGLDKLFVIENTIDFQALGAANGDTVQCLPVAAGWRILGLEVETVTSADSATAATADVGDSGSANGFMDDINLKSAAGTVITAQTATGYGNTRRYTSADTINMTLTYTGATTQKGKVKIRAIVVKMTDD